MKKYYKICLVSPLWFPALLFLIYYTGESLSGSFIDVLPQWFAMLSVIFGFSVVFGGLQYILTLVFIWRKIDFDSFESWRKWILLLPLIFTPIQVLGMWLFTWMIEGQYIDTGMSAGLIAFDIGVAYSYVAVWLVGCAVINTIQNFRRRGEVYEA